MAVAIYLQVNEDCFATLAMTFWSVFQRSL